MSDAGEPIPTTYEWKYENREVVTPKTFLTEIFTKMQAKDVFSVGEYHDENTDQTYSFLLRHQGEILAVYNWYRQYSNLSRSATRLPFERLLPHGSTLIEEMDSLNPTMDQHKKMHVGRLFGTAILPLARHVGYTDLVLEGIHESNPGATLELSKDRVGDLLRLTTAMRLGMKIHGAYDTSRFPTGKGVADALWLKIKGIKDEDPIARVIVYNGAAHNMTQPFQGEISEGFMKYDASELSYAPKARELWGNKYGAIDLLNGDRLLPTSHFRHMQEHAQPGAITKYTYGINQETYVLK